MEQGRDYQIWKSRFPLLNAQFTSEPTKWRADECFKF